MKLATGARGAVATRGTDGTRGTIGVSECVADVTALGWLACHLAWADVLIDVMMIRLMS
jgi:hypothetical protein